MGMRRVITYGTFDLMHYGHINLLKRAKQYGDYLVVSLADDEFSKKHNNKNCYFKYEERKQLLESIRYVDLVIPQPYFYDKIADIEKYHINTVVMGDDWQGEYSFLEPHCEVVYLPRTPEISTSKMKKDNCTESLNNEIHKTN